MRAAIPLAITFAVLTVATALLRAILPRSPAVLVTLGGAVAAGIALAIKPALAAISKERKRRVGRELKREDRAAQIEREVSGLARGLPLVSDIDDRGLLGIHPSIPLPGGAEDTSLQKDLPLYVPRDLDADLRAWMTAHTQKGGFLLLVGKSTAGKTRTAYELLREIVPGWRLFMATSPAQVSEYVAAGLRPEHLVIWLNETQAFLGRGGLTAATIRSALSNKKQPVIIVGTIWPQHYADLTAAAAPGALGDNDARHAREILMILADRFDLHLEFSSAERIRAGRLASRDPRIAEAAAFDAGSGIPATLAAAPELIHRWSTDADAPGAAVITAAVTARRCGHPDPVPGDVLEPLALAALTGAERAQLQGDWFTAALGWASEPQRGIAIPLTAEARVLGTVDGYRVSDVLVQYGGTHADAPGHEISDATWLDLISHATPDACQAIAAAAYLGRHAHQGPVAETASRKAAEAGHHHSMYTLGLILDEQDRPDEAGAWLRRAIAGGHVDAMFALGALLARQDRPAAAADWFGRAADAGHTHAMFTLGRLAVPGDLAAAEKWWRRAADGGHVDAMLALSALMDEQGRPGDAADWLHAAAGAGDTRAMFTLGRLAVPADLAAAEEWWRQAAAGGHVDAMLALGGLMSRQHRPEAVEWFGRAADAGHTHAMFLLGRLAVPGDLAVAEEWWRRAADGGHVDAMLALGELMEGRHNLGDAAQWRRQAAVSPRPEPGTAEFPGLPP